MAFISEKQQRDLMRLLDLYNKLTRLISMEKIDDLTLTNVQIGQLNLKLVNVVKQIKAIVEMM